MSVKELKFDEGPFGTDLRISMEEEKFLIEMSSMDSYERISLDRNQANLLYLYLQEHLGYAKTQAPSS